ncbi:Protein mono-ADP-ribosyltransferase PARP6 [Lamellibrachia satsuma]|nr:Protein mono-ADP-ribosyltransferase PARP6 [Lamellibrachia satsuma]
MPGAPLTKDEKNFWRLVRIMFEDVPGKLRGLFKSKFHEHFKLAWGDNQTSGEFFLANSNIRHTCHRVTDVIKQGDTAQYDFTALFTCLLFSGCGNGILLWSLKCCVNELHEMRHDLAHASSASLTHASFVKKLTSLNVAYAQLQWNPTVMRQWARNPMVTAKCVHLQLQLDAEKQRYTSLDLIVPDLDRTVQETAVIYERTNISLPVRVQKSNGHLDDESSDDISDDDDDEYDTTETSDDEEEVDEAKMNSRMACDIESFRKLHGSDSLTYRAFPIIDDIEISLSIDMEILDSETAAAWKVKKDEPIIIRLHLSLSQYPDGPVDCICCCLSVLMALGVLFFLVDCICRCLSVLMALGVLFFLVDCICRCLSVLMALGVLFFLVDCICRCLSVLMALYPDGPVPKVDVFQPSQQDYFSIGSQLRKILESFIKSNWTGTSQDFTSGNSCTSSAIPAEALPQMLSMGFCPTLARNALAMCGGDVQEAIDLLISDPDRLLPPAPPGWPQHVAPLPPKQVLGASGQEATVAKMEAACQEAASEPRSSPSVEPSPSTGIWLDLEAATVHARKIKEVPTLQFGLLVQLMLYARQRLLTLNEFCIVCDEPDVFPNAPMLKPAVCSRDLCIFSLLTLGVMADVARVIAFQPEVVDVLVTMAIAACRSPRQEVVFDPYPMVVAPHSSTQLAFDPKKKVFKRVSGALTGITSVNVATLCGSQLKEDMDRCDALAYPLLQWIITSNRSHIVKLSLEKQLSFMHTPHQFLLLSSPPTKEVIFTAAKQKYGSTFAFHGSPPENWHSILRHGLMNASNTKFQMNGHKYGSGIYLSPRSDVAFHYSRINVTDQQRSTGGNQAMVMTNNRQFLGMKNPAFVALCEVVTSHNLEKCTDHIWLTTNPNHVCTRFFFVGEGQQHSVIEDQTTSSGEGQQHSVGEDQTSSSGEGQQLCERGPNKFQWRRTITLCGRGPNKFQWRRTTTLCGRGPNNFQWRRTTLWERNKQVPVEKDNNTLWERTKQLPVEKDNNTLWERTKQVPVEKDNNTLWERTKQLPVEKDNNTLWERTKQLPVEKDNNSERTKQVPVEKDNNTLWERAKQVPVEKENNTLWERTKQLPVEKDNNTLWERTKQVPVEKDNNTLLERTKQLPVEKDNNSRTKQLPVEKDNNTLWERNKQLPVEKDNNTLWERTKQLPVEKDNNTLWERTKQLPVEKDNNTLGEGQQLWERTKQVPVETDNNTLWERTKQLPVEKDNNTLWERTKQLPVEKDNNTLWERTKQLPAEKDNNTLWERTKQVPVEKDNNTLWERTKQLPVEKDNNTLWERTKQLPAEKDNNTLWERTKQLPVEKDINTLYEYREAGYRRIDTQSNVYRDEILRAVKYQFR